ncbi:MAG: ATP-binding cassette domain-containing protein, partial [Ruthenibacterium sp.]
MELSVEIYKKFKNFTLEVSFRGDHLALLGASGSGKSLTLQAIAGIMTADCGHIALGDTVLFDSAAHINLPPQERHVGYLFQQYALFPNMTVAQNVAVALRGEPDIKAQTAEKLRQFRLAALSKQLPATLSGGEKQRVALARIFASKPRAILLDEPFAALDSYLKWQLEQELAQTLAAYAGAIVWVSHDRGEVYRNCPQVCVLEQGRSQPVVPTKALFADPATVSAARLSGCKNFVSVVPDGNRVRIPDWGISLDCGRPVPQEIHSIGLRAGQLYFGTENPICCTRVRTVEDISQTILSLRPK